MAEENRTYRLHAQYAYIDTSCFEDEDFDWKGRSISRLSTLVNAGEITLLTTKITKHEINRRLSKAIDKIELDLRSVKSGIMKTLQRHGVSPISNSSNVKKDSVEEFGNFIKEHKFLLIPLTRDVDAIVSQWSENSPPFSKDKSNEFKDAIVIQSVREWAVANSQKTYLVASDGDWKDCCTDADLFIHRNSVDELISDARNLMRGREELRKSLMQNGHFLSELSKLIKALPSDISLPASLRERAGEIETGEIKLVHVERASYNYFGLEIVEIDDVSSSLICAVRLEIRLTFEVSENVCMFLYGDEYKKLLRQSHKSGAYHLFSEMMFRAEIKVRDFNIEAPNQIHVDDIQLLTPLIRTPLSHR